MITLTTEQAQQIEEALEGYRIGLAEMREKCATVVTEHAPTCSPHWVSYVAAIRAIKFEGDTGFRPVSEMIAEHKQDPKKAAVIEKAKMRKAEQKPVGVVEGSGEWGIAGVLVAGVPIGTKLYAEPFRTKDLTDDEIMKINVDTAGIVPTCDRQFHFARAVIQEYRRKNGIV